jgi:hypothetical protein
MSDPKTLPTDASVDDFLASVTPARRRDDGRSLLVIMQDVTGEPGTMWGPSIVGFGTRHFTYATGREGDWMRVGFSPRKAQLSLYGLKDSAESTALLTSLGTYTEGAGCVYVRTLDDINTSVLRELVGLGYALGDYTA